MPRVDNTDAGRFCSILRGYEVVVADDIGLSDRDGLVEILIAEVSASFVAFAMLLHDPSTGSVRLNLSDQIFQHGGNLSS